MSASWLQLQNAGWSALVTIGVGCTLTVAAAWIVTRLLRTPRTKRRAWRVAMVVCLLMTVGEVTGLTRYATAAWTIRAAGCDVTAGAAFKT